MNLIKRLIFAPFCAGCMENLNIFAEDFSDKAAFCAGCADEWERAKILPCSVCRVASLDCVCVPDVLNDIRIVSLIKFGRVKSADSLIYVLKKRNSKRLFEFAADELSRRFELFAWEYKMDMSEMVITHVPRKRASVIRYGFDHAKNLALGVSKKLNIPFVSVLRRKGGGKDQKKLGAKERLKSAQDQFKLREDSCVLLKDKVILLVDDVVTSGATCAACIDLLRFCEPKEIIILSIAKSNLMKKKNKDNDKKEKGKTERRK